jgi:hypothetical protein
MSIKNKVLAFVFGALVAAIPASFAFADPTPAQDITASMSTGFTSAVADILAGVSGILPIVIPVVAAITLVTVGYRVFKKFSKG